MDRKMATVVGATAALIAGSAATQAATPATDTPAVSAASNYNQLLEPIPNAVERLKVANAQDRAHRAELEKVQFSLQLGVPPAYHHHHHHHHSHDWYLRHGYVWFDGRWVTRDFFNHHHHHHHHHG
jgi:hypothetical protein